MNPRTILFIHQSFPGQFGALAQSLAEEGHRVFALALNPQKKIPGVTTIRYLPPRQQESEKWPFLLRDMDAKLIRAEGAHVAMKSLKEHGLKPDVIYAHPGWGESLFVKNVWPKARYVVYAEWFYNLEGQEVNFDPEAPKLTEEEELRLAFKNMPFLQALSECDMAIAPTEWQKSRFPEWAQKKIQVVHEGLNLRELEKVRPRALGIPSQGLKLRKGMPIVTYCARHLEPVRGFNYFMRAVPEILSRNRDAHVIVMGQDAGVGNRGYGRQNPTGKSWRKTMEKELGDRLDLKRIHFLGMLDRKLYQAVLKLSACHIYLTIPFILSWSYLEAAALGLPIVASNTAPVREFDNLDGVNLVEFTDVEGIASRALLHLENPNQNFFEDNLHTLENLSLERTLPRQKEILLTGSPAADLGNHLEEIVFIEDE